MAMQDTLGLFTVVLAAIDRAAALLTTHPESTANMHTHNVALLSKVPAHGTFAAVLTRSLHGLPT
jgi:hypothetical protein